MYRPPLPKQSPDLFDIPEEFGRKSEPAPPGAKPSALPGGDVLIDVKLATVELSVLAARIGAHAAEMKRLLRQVGGRAGSRVTITLHDPQHQRLLDAYLRRQLRAMRRGDAAGNECDWQTWSD